MSNKTEAAKELLQKLDGELTALCREIAVEQPLDPEALASMWPFPS